MDRFAQRSQERAVAAQASGFSQRELTPYTKALLLMTLDAAKDGFARGAMATAAAQLGQAALCWTRSRWGRP